MASSLALHAYHQSIYFCGRIIDRGWREAYDTVGTGGHSSSSSTLSRPPLMGHWSLDRLYYRYRSVYPVVKCEERGRRRGVVAGGARGCKARDYAQSLHVWSKPECGRALGRTCCRTVLSGLQFHPVSDSAPASALCCSWCDRWAQSLPDKAHAPGAAGARFPFPITWFLSPPLSFSPCHGITELFARMQSTATICTGDPSAAAFGSFVDRGTPRCHTHILDAHILDQIHTYSMKSRKYTHYFTGDPNAAACVHVVHGIGVCHRGGQRFPPINRGDEG